MNLCFVCLATLLLLYEPYFVDNQHVSETRFNEEIKRLSVSHYFSNFTRIGASERRTENRRGNSHKNAYRDIQAANMPPSTLRQKQSIRPRFYEVGHTDYLNNDTTE
jgi:hypothetical protein